MKSWERCEGSKRVTHCSLPHGPCEPSAQVTGRAQTYVTDLPKRDSTLPEAASERDQCSPHHPHRLPCHSTSLLYHHHLETTIPHDLELLTPSYNTTSPRTRCSPYHMDCICRYSASTNRIRPVPWRMDNLPRFRSQTLSHTRWTYCVPDTDPLDKADNIPTQPVPHFTRRID
jgi:hypothetical protein